MEGIPVRSVWLASLKIPVHAGVEQIAHAQEIVQRQRCVTLVLSRVFGTGVIDGKRHAYRTTLRPLDYQIAHPLRIPGSKLHISTHCGNAAEIFQTLLHIADVQRSAAPQRQSRAQPDSRPEPSDNFTRPTTPGMTVNSKRPLPRFCFPATTRVVV